MKSWLRISAADCRATIKSWLRDLGSGLPSYFEDVAAVLLLDDDGKEVIAAVGNSNVRVGTVG